MVREKKLLQNFALCRKCLRTAVIDVVNKSHPTFCSMVAILFRGVKPVKDIEACVLFVSDMTILYFDILYVYIL